ncbi:MAG: hypothetical protein GX081_01425 [Firmicutes bacterium]|nr:hypothetical protein [Bacillota bacterium]
MIRIENVLRYTDFNLLRFLHYTFQGKLRTATLLLYLACLKAFPGWDRDELYDKCYAKTVLIYKTFL